MQPGTEESSLDICSSPTDIEEAIERVEKDRGKATTPLLPPMMMEMYSQNVPVQSPLQSPAVAETSSLLGSNTPTGTPRLNCLPSPPLSTKPSIASIRQRSRAVTVVPSSEIPALQILDECDDEWSARLGHANFTIYPEPYLPNVFDMETFRQLREDWDQARHGYAKHIARTGEHYGTTSKTYLLTEKKWASVNAHWKHNNAAMTDTLETLVSHSSTSDLEISESTTSSKILEKLPTKVVVPKIHDPTGKFPDMGDEDIVGPMAVGPSRAMTVQHLIEPALQNRVSKKRNFFKFISDILGRGAGSGFRT